MNRLLKILHLNRVLTTRWVVSITTYLPFGTDLAVHPYQQVIGLSLYLANRGIFFSCHSKCGPSQQFATHMYQFIYFLVVFVAVILQLVHSVIQTSQLLLSKKGLFLFTLFLFCVNDRAAASAALLCDRLYRRAVVLVVERRALSR